MSFLLEFGLGARPFEAVATVSEGLSLQCLGFEGFDTRAPILQPLSPAVPSERSIVL
jgi:hypothetical protein